MQQHKYDDLGRLKEVTYSSGQKIEYTYDAGGNILSVKDVSAIKLNPIGNKTVFVGEELKFTVTAVGQEGSVLEYSASNLPEGAVFNTQTGEFSWTPTSTQVGVYTKVTFQVTDGTNTAKQGVTITVKSKVIKGDINGDGVFNSIDLALMKMYLTGSIKFTEEQFEAADVDNSGEVNSID
ncbi:putative Ig domain-containing protein [Acetivibrio clariflavus]|uniref:Putative Ig domain-containing protein,RHS repeat protein,dockerin-like protein n=1 Tax=Acetivibrio clariflavus (strain DSM 19732 / NBRC 101661 / EBR45) TaxID=720554 RepID=G8M2A0_ACECE|nr:putative Ig domain-containing protein [Acetivibrio clariflavus]AEV69259.1 putative Ig domain-containing protein,RHS repeat protein,dockerin-like protein [Acetivibrio clariflavus DSM 19732]